MLASHRATIARVEDLMRRLDEMCLASAKLRRQIQREMRASRAREQLGFADDTDVTRCRTRNR